MSRFHYFFPGATTEGEGNSALARAGLDPVIESGGRTWRGIRGGPGDQVGQLMTNAGGGEHRAAYLPETQTWRECGDDETGRFWIGYTTDTPPAPLDLVRPEVVDGHLIELSDGESWTVPMARVFPFGTRLPQTMALGPNHTTVKEVLPRYAALSHAAERIFEQVIEHGRWTEDDLLLIGLCSDALSVNYFVGEWELAAALRIFDTRSIRSIIEALIDWPTVQEIEALASGKKKSLASGQSTSSDGSTAKSGPISRPSASCT